MTNRSGKYAIVASRFNDFITKRLLKVCLEELAKKGVKKNDVTTVWVPGAFEIPLIALKLAQKKNVDAVIALGAVIRGETYHFELVARGVAEGILRASLMTGKPVILGVLSTDNINQAYARSQETADNKGRDAAEAAVAMVNLLRGIKK